RWTSSRYCRATPGHRRRQRRRRCGGPKVSSCRAVRSWARSCLGFASRARMGCVVDLDEMLEIKVNIDLRGRHVRVPEQFLHTAQILARLQQMTRERMAEHVRMNMAAQSLVPRPAFDALLHDAHADATAAHADEQCCLAPLGQRRPLLEPARNR